VIDDVGLLTAPPTRSALFRVTADAAEQRSIAISSNIRPRGWTN
jgi:hypothetical protein